MYGRRILILAFALLVASCGDDAATTTTSTTTATTSTTVTSSITTTQASPPDGVPVIIDTDMATEGIMSILYLLGQEGLSVRAITVSGTGLVHCEPGVEQALGLVELVGTEGVDVACGPEDPIEGINTFPSAWRAGADLAYGVELPMGGEPVASTAPELIVSVVTASPVPVVVYADGPQTNLAAALRLDPSIAGNIERVFIMGGAFDVPGTVTRNPNAEWNVWVDPVALDEVLGSGIPITLVPLDATNQVPFTVFHRNALESHEGGAALAAVVTMLRGNEQVTSGGLYFWDQLLAAIIVDDGIVASEPANVSITLTGDRDTSGTTVRSDDGHPVDLVVNVDREAFEQEFLSGIAGEPVGPVVVAPDWDIVFASDGLTTDLSDGAVLVGDYTVWVANDSGSGKVVVAGWLTGEATRDDLEAWTSAQQPPFFEVLTVIFAAPGTDLVAEVSFPDPRAYYVVTLDVEADRSTVVAELQVSG